MFSGKSKVRNEELDVVGVFLENSKLELGARSTYSVVIEIESYKWGL